MKNMHIEVDKLRETFNAQGSNFMSLNNGDAEFSSPDEINDEEIQDTLEEQYPKKNISHEGKRFVINF